jgi:hypothetical protein
MKYSKELHEAMRAEAIYNVERSTVGGEFGAIAALLDEIERLQAENTRLSNWIDNVTSTARVHSITPPPPEEER